jgi:hypothetical protein
LLRYLDLRDMKWGQGTLHSINPLKISVKLRLWLARQIGEQEIRKATRISQNSFVNYTCGRPKKVDWRKILKGNMMMLTGLTLMLVWYSTTTSPAIHFRNSDVVCAVCGSRWFFLAHEFWNVVPRIKNKLLREWRIILIYVNNLTASLLDFFVVVMSLNSSNTILCFSVAHQPNSPPYCLSHDTHITE